MISGFISVVVTGGICLLVVVAVGALLFLLYRSAKKTNENIAQVATATVTRLVDSASGGRNYGGVDIEMVLNVRPPNGLPYETRTSWAVEPAMLSKVQEGCTVVVKIDSKDPKRIYPVEEWAEFLDVPPSSFSDNPEE